MKVEIKKELKNSSCIVTISILEPEIGNYLQNIEAFGEVPINLGGEVTDSTSKTVLASLSNWSRKVTEIITTPIVQKFQISQYGETTEKVALQWASDVSGRIDSYVETMSKKIDEFSGTTVIDI